MSTWSYSGNPGSSPKDATRFLIGDTNQCDQLLQDAEITWILGQYNNSPINAAIRCVETIMSKFSRMADENVGRVRIDFSQKAKAYRAMRDDLIHRLATEDMTPYAGGISVSDTITQVQNKDRVKPDFTKHMMENQQISPWVSNGLESFLKDQS
jgi:hypothetical protein